MDISRAHHVLAAGINGEGGANGFLTSPIGKTFSAICGVVAIVIVVTCVLRMIRSVTTGRPGEGFRVLTFGLVIGGLLFDLSITVSAVHYMSDLIKKIFDSTDQITG